MTMTTILPDGVTGGIDTHADVHVAAVLTTATARLLGTASFDTTPAGDADLLEWMRDHGPIDRVGIEGTGTYGAGLARFLTAEGIDLVEVDRPDRKARRLSGGKSDVVDAEAAARAVLSGRATGTPKTRDGIVEAIRMWQVVYHSAVKSRTATINQFTSLVTTAPAAVRAELAGLSTVRRRQQVLGWRTRPTDDLVTGAARACLRALASRLAELDVQANEAEHELDVLTDQASPALRDVFGVGIHAAAQLLVTFGDNPDRVHNEAALAALCGVAPVSASSGKTTRHRINRGGDRAANKALWDIAMARLSHDDRTKTYAARRTAMGKSKGDTIRNLKRAIVREVYRAVVRPGQLAPRGHELRELRTQAGLTQIALAEQVGITNARLSRIERGITRNPAQQRMIHAWLTRTDQLCPTA